MERKEYDVCQMMAVLNLDEAGLLYWTVGLNPVMMEEWAKVCQIWGGIQRGDLIEFVRTVNDPRFLPVAPTWRSTFQGVSSVRWTVGQDASRLILAEYVGTYMPKGALSNPEGIKEKFLVALEHLRPDELNVEVDIHGIHVRMWWD